MFKSENIIQNFCTEIATLLWNIDCVPAAGDTYIYILMGSYHEAEEFKDEEVTELWQVKIFEEIASD